MVLLKKIIEGLKPYNKIFYRDCFYNSFFPIVKLYGGQIEEYLINDVPCYTWDFKSKKLELEYIEEKQMDQILDNQNIIVYKKYASEEIIIDIKNSLNENRVVIVYIDCFYEKMRRDTYLKVHLPHTILIYGYDDVEEHLNIIEHRNKDGLSYDFRTIEYEEVEKAYASFLQRFYVKQLKPIYFDYALLEGKEEKQKVSSYYERYKSNIKFHEEMLKQGLEIIKEIPLELRCLLSDQDTLSQMAKQLIQTLNSIINAKLAEEYKLKLIEADTKERMKQLEKIIHNWSLIRIEIVRFTYSNTLGPVRLLPIEQLLEEVYAAENKYVEEF